MTWDCGRGRNIRDNEGMVPKRERDGFLVKYPMQGQPYAYSPNLLPLLFSLSQFQAILIFRDVIPQTVSSSHIAVMFCEQTMPDSRERPLDLNKHTIRPRCPLRRPQFRCASMQTTAPRPLPGEIKRRSIHLMAATRLTGGQLVRDQLEDNSISPSARTIAVQ